MKNKNAKLDLTYKFFSGIYHDLNWYKLDSFKNLLFSYSEILLTIYKKEWNCFSL